MKTIILATHNHGKVAEFNELLSAFAYNFVPQSQFGVPDIEETGLSFVENALLKARHASQLTGMPALADDSGICIDALKGAPGIYSARYAGEHGNSKANIAKVLAELKDVPKNQRQAKFVCCLVYVEHADDQLPLVYQGIWPGEILFAEQGEKGFGYDPIFYVPDYHCSAAELAPEVKNKISHRARALAQLASLALY